MKKIIKSVLAVSLVSVLAFPACKKETEYQVSDELFVALENANVERFSTTQLELGKDVKEVTWSSSDESVAVIENGELIGLKAGTAVISAILGNEKQEQTITVIDEGKSPTIDVDYLPVMLGKSYQMDAKACFDGLELSDVSFNYSVADTSIATIEDDVLSGVAYGETTVTISMSWRGQQNVTTKTVPCAVTKNVAVYTDKAEYTLYSLGSVLGEEFITETQIQTQVYYEGKKVDGLTLTWESADTNIATVDANGKVNAVAHGETYVVGTCEYNGETLSTRKVPVKVEKPHVKTNLEIPFKAGTSSMTFDIDGCTIGKVVNLATGTVYPCTDNSANLRNLVTGEYKFVVYEENEAFSAEVQVIIADYLVSTKKDLEEATAVKDAYVVLLNDINAGSFKTSRYDRNDRCTGTFNGLGHTITVTYASTNRSLYAFVDDFTFKNLGIKCTVSADRGSGALFYQGSGNIIDNCYLETTITNENGMYHGGVADRPVNMKMSNTIVKVNGLGKNEYVKTHCGALCGRLATAKLGYTNTYVISAEGTLTTDAYGGTQASWLNAREGLLYRSEEAVVADKNEGYISFDGFNHYWDLTGDFPVFKSSK